MAIITQFPTFTQRPVTGNLALTPDQAAPDHAPRKRGATQDEEQRLAMLAKIHIALDSLYKKHKGFSEDVYRYYLAEQYGKDSAAELTNRQLHQTLLWLARIGWQSKRGRHRTAAPHALECDTLPGRPREELLQKIEAQLAEKGRAEGKDMPWGYAVGILKRQSGGVTKSLDQATCEQLAGVIAALWRDAKRKKRRVR